MTQLVADPDRALVLAYALADRRPALAALFRLDEALGGVMRGAREPLLRQMRLTWWHGALSQLGCGAAPADPALADLLTTRVVPDNVRGGELASIIEGWEALLEDPADLDGFARMRGGAMFRIAGVILGQGDAQLEQAGMAWALADLARHSGSSDQAARALNLAAAHARTAMGSTWPKELRALGALAALALRDAVRGVDRLEPAGHPARMLRALSHRLTGR